MTALLMALASPSIAGATEPAEPDAQPDAQVQEIYAQGQRLFEEGEYSGAAEAWTAMLTMLPEGEAHRLTRSSTVYNIVSARLLAFRRERTADGLQDDRQLVAARDLLAAYRAEYEQSYGADAALDPRLIEISEELEAEGTDTWVGPCLSPPPPCLSPCLSVIPPSQRGCGGGRRDDDDGLAWLGLLALPAVGRRRRDALQRMSSRLPADVVQRLGAQLDDDDDDDDEGTAR